MNIKRTYLEIITFILSAMFAILVHTPYYITGLLTYSWGHIARGGIVFQILVFMLFCSCVWDSCQYFKIKARKE